MATVALKEFGVIRIFDKAFAVRTRTLFADEISFDTAEWLDTLVGCATCEVDEAQKSLLDKLRLLAEAPVSEGDIREYNEALVKRAQSALFPRTLELMVAQGCNMHCVYCYGGGGEYGSPGFMPRTLAFRAIDFYRDTLREHDPEGKVTPQIVFFGGEPLLNEKLIRECVLYAESLWPKVEFGTTTNLTLLTEELLDFFIAHHVRMVVSYDGTPELQRRNRPMNDGSDSYAVFAEKARMLLKKAPNTPCRATRSIDEDEQKIADGIRALGFRDGQVNAVSGTLSKAVTQADVFIDYRERTRHLLEMCPRMIEAARARDEQAAEALWHAHPNIAFILQDMLRVIAPPRKLIDCGSGRTMFALSVDGTWYPCHRFVGSKYQLGTLEGGLDMRLNHLHQILNNPKCRACWLRYGCGHPCMYVCACDAPDEPGVDPLVRAPEAYCEETRTAFAVRLYLHSALTREERSWLMGRRYSF